MVTSWKYELPLFQCKVLDVYVAMETKDITSYM